MTLTPTPLTKESGISPAVWRKGKRGWRWLFGVLGLALAWHALRGVVWTEVWTLLTGIGPLSILAILAVNLLLLPLMAARWWLLLRTMGSPVDLLSACAYRLAAGAVSYLTPGPHFGGEPLSVYLLHHRHRIPLATATTSVAVDRLLELSASLAVLSLCLIHLTSAENGLFEGSRGLYSAIAMLMVFSCILTALFTGHRPLSRVVFLFRRPGDGGTFLQIILETEIMAQSLFRRHRRQFLLANLFSLGHWLGVFAEFWLMSVFLGLPLSFWHLSAVVAVARLAFFTPLPAGIGVLESALPWLTTSLGLGPALGLSLCLIIRFRDLLFNLTGLALAMKYLTCHGKIGIIDHTSVR